MASDVQDGGRKSREPNFEIWQYFCIHQSFAMSSATYFELVKISKKWWIDPRWQIADQNQFFSKTREIVNIFTINFLH
jgi:hypothetical protein